MEDKQNVLSDYYKAKLQLEILTLQVKEKQEEVLKYLENNQMKELKLNTHVLLSGKLQFMNLMRILKN